MADEQRQSPGERPRLPPAATLLWLLLAYFFFLRITLRYLDDGTVFSLSPFTIDLSIIIPLLISIILVTFSYISLTNENSEIIWINFCSKCENFSNFIWRGNP